MLYKKVHRQFVREFWEGRRFKYNDSSFIYEVTKESYIEKDDDGNYISTDRWYLISLDSGKIMTGILHNKTWLD